MAFRSKLLACGCCGKNFRTWPEYKDQDCDKGYGTCEPCQTWQSERNEAEWVKLEEKVINAFNEKNRIKFMEYEKEVRRGLILEMIDDGIISYGPVRAKGD